MITRLVKYRVYHLYDSLTKGECVPIAYIGILKTTNLAEGLRAGWQFVALSDFKVGGGNPQPLGKALVHPADSNWTKARKQLYGVLYEATTCPHHKE